MLIPVVELGGRRSQKSACRVRRARFSSSPVCLPGDPGKVKLLLLVLYR